MFSLLMLSMRDLECAGERISELHKKTPHNKVPEIFIFDGAAS